MSGLGWIEGDEDARCQERVRVHYGDIRVGKDGNECGRYVHFVQMMPNAAYMRLSGYNNVYRVRWSQYQSAQT